jgi:hypothetical protein
MPGTPVRWISGHMVESLLMKTEAATFLPGIIRAAVPV